MAQLATRLSEYGTIATAAATSVDGTETASGGGSSGWNTRRALATMYHIYVMSARNENFVDCDISFSSSLSFLYP
jgi:hypothetical protein